MDEIRINSIGIPWINAQAGAVSIVQIYRDSSGHINCGGNYLPGDANEDCYVDLADFAVFTEDWLRCTDPEDPNCVEWFEQSTAMASMDLMSGEGVIVNAGTNNITPKISTEVPVNNQMNTGNKKRPVMTLLPTIRSSLNVQPCHMG